MILIHMDISVIDDDQINPYKMFLISYEIFPEPVQRRIYRLSNTF